MVVGVVDRVEQLAALGEEGAHLAVAPAGEDAAAVVHELDTVALEAWYLNAEQLLARLGVPYTDVVDRAGGEQVGEAGGEGDVVDALAVAGVAELGGDRVRVAPVDRGLCGAREEVGRVGGHRDGSAGTHQLALALNLHARSPNSDLRNSTVSSANHQVTVGEELHAVEALGEELARADALEEALVEVDLDDVAGEGAHVGGLVLRVDDNALVDATDLAHGKVLEKDLLLDVVDVPDADAVVVDGDEVVVGLVEEADLVRHVHADGVATDSVSALRLI